MTYLYSLFPCSLEDKESTTEILPNVFYELKDIQNKNFYVVGNGNLTYHLNFSIAKNGSNVDVLNLESNTFFILKNFKITNPHFVQFKCGNFNFSVSVSNNLMVCVDGEVLLIKPLTTEIEYSSFEFVNNKTIIYFEGIRKFVVIVENKELKFADYYDELNIENEMRIFMKRQHDILNHGKVVKVENDKLEKYLVYLDDNELKMKNEFCFLVFLDCLIAGNLKYCNELLGDGVKQKDENKILKFFKEFDFYIPFKNFAITYKKNTLSGVYKFECCNNKIENIIHLM